MQVLPKGQWKLSRTWGVGSSRMFSGSTVEGGKDGRDEDPREEGTPASDWRLGELGRWMEQRGV